MKTKRILSLFLLLLLVLVPLAAGRAEGDTCPSSDDGQHNWVVYENPPTCTDPGMREYQCTKCYASRDYETLPALGHDYVERVDKAATCTEAGHAYWVCSRCSDMQEVTLPATGHTWDNGVVTQAPTCAAEGVRTFTCLRCGATRTEAIAKTADHTPVSVPGKAATCTEAGLTDGSKCSTCGAVLTAQQSIPAKGHSPVAVPGKAATCTEAGLTDGSQCATCGAVLTAQQSIPALGHAFDGGAVTVAPTCVDKGYRTNTCTRCGATELTGIPPTGEHTWDEGAITAEPTGLTPGVMTFTCTVCGATKTEAVDPTLSVFSGMDIPSGFGFLRTGDPISDILRIVTQPEGGFVPQGGYTELTVEAAGGEGAYTYEWWYAPALPTVGTSALTDFLTGFYGDTVATVSQAKEKTTPLAAEFLEAWKKQNGISGTVDHSVTVTEGTIASTETETMTMEIFNPLAEKLSTSPEPGCNAWKSGTYWCVVYDEAGHHATSDKVQMKDGLYIAVQPESKNLYGLSSVDLTCRAGGGSGNYAYTWYDGNGNVVEDQQTYVAEQMGVYYCEVADYDTLEVVQSQSALAYYAERDLRPVITLQPESVILIPQEDGQYSWSMACLAQTFDGGSEDLQYDWFGKTDAGWAPIASGNVLTRSYDHGTFRCKVTDKRNGAYVSSDEAKVALIMASEQPTVTPAFGVLAWNQHFDFNFPFKGGVSPYHVDVYQVSYNNVPGIEPVVTHYNSYVTYSGDNIVIYDAPYVHFVFIEQNGEEKKYEDYYKYYVTVTDASGQEQTSESVWYWDAETTR